MYAVSDEHGANDFGLCMITQICQWIRNSKVEL